MAKVLNAAEVVEATLQAGRQAALQGMVDTHIYPVITSVKVIDELTVQVMLENEEVYRMTLEQMK